LEYREQPESNTIVDPQPFLALSALVRPVALAFLADRPTEFVREPTRLLTQNTNLRSMAISA
jgi:hypothetical protein